MARRGAPARSPAADGGDEAAKHVAVKPGDEILVPPGVYDGLKLEHVFFGLLVQVSPMAVRSGSSLSLKNSMTLKTMASNRPGRSWLASYRFVFPRSSSSSCFTSRASAFLACFSQEWIVDGDFP